MKKIARDVLVTFAVVAVAFLICLLLDQMLNIGMLSCAIFVLAVFMTSLLTERMIYGIVASMAGVLAVNYAFTFPFFKFNFTIFVHFLSFTFTDLVNF